MIVTTSDLKINSDRLREDFEIVADIGATVGGGVSRLALSNEDLEVRAWFANRIEEAGFWLHDDEVGNLSGVLFSSRPDARTLLVGSHLDTVPNSGRFDGTVGVLSALECLRTIAEAGVELPFHLEAIDFTDEEGVWQSFFGSMGLTGTLSPSHINDAERDNAAFRAALFRAGINPTEVARAKRNPNSLLGFLELHIEQGRQLERSHCDIGVVTRIVGRTVYTFTFHGEAAHSGTTPLEERRDALQGAAVFITRSQALVRDVYPGGVVNCGKVDVSPGSFNIVPEKASLRLECRHPDPETLASIESELIRLAQNCAIEYRLTVSPQRVLHRSPAPMAPELIEAIETACDKASCCCEPIISYAGHDAQILSPFTPSAMIFIPSVQGVSHNPREFTEWKYVELGANILLGTILELARRYPDAC